jgi:hypothetical protein
MNHNYDAQKLEASSSQRLNSNCQARNSSTPWMLMYGPQCLQVPQPEYTLPSPSSQPLVWQHQNYQWMIGAIDRTPRCILDCCCWNSPSKFFRRYCAQTTTTQFAMMEGYLFNLAVVPNAVRQEVAVVLEPFTTVHLHVQHRNCKT